MKRLLLPLVVATPFLTAVVPHADAAAITVNHGSLNPRLIGAGKLHRRFNNGVPAPGFKTDHFVEAISASVEESLATALSSGALAITKTGAGTLILSAGTLRVGTDSTNVLSGSLTIDQTSLISVGTIGGLIDVNGSTLTLTGANTLGGGGTLTINSGVLTGGFVNVTGSTGFGVGQTLTGLNLVTGGTVTLESVPATPSSGTISLLPNSSNGTLTINGGNGLLLNAGNVNGAGGTLTLGGGQTTSPAAPVDPVPEPGTAMLFVLGMLAASQTRRRRA